MIRLMGARGIQQLRSLDHEGLRFMAWGFSPHLNIPVAR